jgi:hypothetical protein
MQFHCSCQQRHTHSIHCMIQGSLDVDEITLVQPTHTTDSGGRPEFVVCGGEKTEKFTAETFEDLAEWLRLLTPKTVENPRAEAEDGRFNNTASSSSYFTNYSQFRS